MVDATANTDCNAKLIQPYRVAARAERASALNAASPKRGGSAGRGGTCGSCGSCGSGMGAAAAALLAPRPCCCPCNSTRHGCICCEAWKVLHQGQVSQATLPPKERLNADMQAYLHPWQELISPWPPQRRDQRPGGQHTWLKGSPPASDTLAQRLSRRRHLHGSSDGWKAGSPLVALC